MGDLDLDSKTSKIIKLPSSNLYSDETALKKTGYTLGKLLGEGAYAKVYTAEYMDAKSASKDPEAKAQILACKIVDGSKAPKEFLKKFFPREIAVICKVNHHYVVRVHSILKLSGKYYLFMTYCENGDLLTFIKGNGAVREPRARRWFAQILEGMDYLHNQKNVVHRDLKCENIMLNAVYNIKITDFGFARTFRDGDEKSKTFCGSVMYAPPEVVHGNPYNPKLADLWSLGVILFIMLNKSMPFDDSSLRKLYEAQMSRAWKIRSKLANVLSREVKTYLYNLLEPYPDNRRTIFQLRKDPWIVRGSFSEATLENPDTTIFTSKIN